MRCRSATKMRVGGVGFKAGAECEGIIDRFWPENSRTGH
jgi:hypothetical protein